MARLCNESNGERNWEDKEGKDGTKEQKPGKICRKKQQEEAMCHESIVTKVG